MIALVAIGRLGQQKIYKNHQHAYFLFGVKEKRKIQSYPGGRSWDYLTNSYVASLNNVVITAVKSEVTN